MCNISFNNLKGGQNGKKNFNRRNVVQNQAPPAAGAGQKLPPVKRPSHNSGRDTMETSHGSALAGCPEGIRSMEYRLHKVLSVEPEPVVAKDSEYFERGSGYRVDND